MQGEAMDCWGECFRILRMDGWGRAFTLFIFTILSYLSLVVHFHDLILSLSCCSFVDGLDMMLYDSLAVVS
jgi:hypothetical protein